jgi:hypothetical protein
MPDFETTTRAPLRFPGDFHVAPIAGHQPTAAEQAYLDTINSFVDQMATDSVDDIAANYSEPLLSGRQAARAAAITALGDEVRKFIGGRNPSGDPAGLIEIRSNYASVLPKFGTTNSAHPRFEGDFDIVFVQGYAPGDGEQAFLASIKAATREFAADKLRDSTGEFSPVVIVSRGKLREATAKELRDGIESFRTGPMAANTAAENVVLQRGRYQAKRDRLTRRLFNVKLQSEKKRNADDDNELILAINLLGGLPSPQDAPSADKQELYVQIHKALTVVRTVTERLGDRSERGLWAWVFGPNQDLQKRSRLLQTEFLEKLYDVAWIGLELEFTALAKWTLAEARNDFFVREAGRIKNMYMRRLGAWSGMAAALFLCAYIALYTKYVDWPWAYVHQSFLLAACGAAIGTWASFSVRQVQFSFDDLVMVEESSLDPPMRLLFVIVLTMAACLLFWNNAINLEIGDLKTQPDHFRAAGSIALLIGLFCGLSERAMATAIAGRATAFVKGIAGGP